MEGNIEARLSIREKRIGSIYAYLDAASVVVTDGECSESHSTHDNASIHILTPQLRLAVVIPPTSSLLNSSSQ